MTRTVAIDQNDVTGNLFFLFPTLCVLWGFTVAIISLSLYVFYVECISKWLSQLFENSVFILSFQDGDINRTNIEMITDGTG